MSVHDEQKRLRKISDKLKTEAPLSSADKQFLSTALSQIADGIDANQALNVKAKRGEHKSKTAQNKRYEGEIKKRLSLGWIATAKARIEDGGLGLTLEQAIARIGENDLNAFGLTEETLKTYWNKNVELRKRDFHLPKPD
ncbi:hypothetical protein [Nitrosomonas supralitoralis]|uniref:Uncharacterized protein n=1 Tax=Nitrosomonas supralitoralis TaxID=2116706 RepID=A0A2P7NR12_9PROT|nr:hypothetical protein [Nitrosomonas supralitoralis]PSJ15894.1 hypothetical protein C7H79_16515 [Nitrosomonas supralitoralis]